MGLIHSSREAVERLQAAMTQFPQMELPTEHFFCKGMYARLVFSPAGTLIVGKVHKTEHFYVLMSGRIRVTTDDGVQEFVGPKVMIGKPGTKRAVLVLEDAWRMNIHLNPSDINDIGSLEDELVEDDPTALIGHGNKVKPGVLVQEMVQRIPT